MCMRQRETWECWSECNETSERDSDACMCVPSVCGFVQLRVPECEGGQYVFCETEQLECKSQCV